MLFVATGRFRKDAEAVRDEIHEQFSDHLTQHGPELRIRLGGSLRDAAGKRTGVLLLVEAAGPENVQRFLDSSPYALGGLYESTSLDLVDLEIGTMA